MTTPEQIYTTAVTQTLNNHVSIRQFTDERIPDAMLRAILNAARRSPTSSNTQTYSLVVVRDPEKKAKLVELAGNQEWIANADVFIAVCADISRMAQANAMHGQQLGKNLENSMVAIVDASLVGMSIQTAAESFGLGACMIGGMRNNPRDAAELLNLPEGVFIVFGMGIGFPDETQRPPQKPRLPEDLIIHYESYSDDDPSGQLKAHDAELAEHYRSLGRNLNAAAWTGVMADKFSSPRRAYLRETLEAMGFSFD